MRKIIIISALFLFHVLLQGCATTPAQQTPNVTSAPSGATVYANSLDIGITPLKKNLFDEFPTGWQGATYTAQGVLSIKKDGCKDFTLKINDRILSEPIHAELECSAANTVKAATPNPPAQDDAEARLKKLESLYNKKLISKEEYQKTRERILNDI